MGKKITLIGGGSSMFVPLILRKAMQEPALAGATIALMDIDAERLEVMHTLATTMIENEGSSMKVESTVDQRASLVDADFVIIGISVGGMAAWEKDIEIPGRYGIYMHVADSIGPGGMMRGLRNLPVIESVCRDVREVAPRAIVMNYTNPATAGAMAMRGVSSVSSLSLCTGTHYPRNAQWLAGLIGVSPEEVVVPVPAAGLNHCTAVLQVRLKDGTDALPIIRARSEEPVLNWFIDTYGVLPYMWYHWAEFFPQVLRLGEPYQGRAQGLEMEYGRRIFIMDEERRRAQRWHDLAVRWNQPEHRHEATLANLPEGEQDNGIEVIDVIASILENRNEMFVVVTRNGGAVTNLPEDAIIEVPAIVGAYGINPITQGALPEAFAAFLRTHTTTQELITEAALTGDRTMARQAFVLDPVTSAVLDYRQTTAMFDELMEANAEFLPAFQ